MGAWECAANSLPATYFLLLTPGLWPASTVQNLPPQANRARPLPLPLAQVNLMLALPLILAQAQPDA